ncbi:hypothetical protein [Gallaecimonas mangrovi]|uniref:hypothetical protein n=1 Tax=Gallaecimonas mangrovi TaxID=2291597 RepID=UPI000E202CBF|nr:hypothetical protein [Gallaecimonas mangrovi]
MRFKTVRDLVNHLCESHFALSKLYQRLADNADAERTRMMLHYLVDHEKKVSDDYASVLKTPGEALDTWFDNAIDSHFDKSLTYVDIKANATQEDVLELALSLDNKLLADIEALVPQCPSQESKTFLEGLLSSAQDIQHRFVHQTMRMQDL